jgi:hypothetical protein
MLCKNALPLLSEFSDEVLDADLSVQISQHLDQCGSCRRELESLSILQGKLKSLKGIQAPEFLGSLVEHRIAEIQRNSWRRDLRNELERTWSKIRTTEGTWYITRALGTVMTSLFFFLIWGNNIPSSFIEDSMKRDFITPADRQQAYQEFLRKMGLPPDPKIRVITSNPAIHEIYLKDMGESMSTPGKDDSASVLAAIDPLGSGKIQSVLKRPNDQQILNNINDMITKARYRPASQNGKPVPSHMIFNVDKVTVYGRLPEGD